MTDTVPLYHRSPALPLESTPPAALTSSCSLCPLGARARTTCMKASGVGGGLLVLGSSPSSHEDKAGRPCSGPAWQSFKQLLKRHWSGPVVFDNAVKCRSSSKEATPARVAACRGYASQVYDDASPVRVLALGSAAIACVTGSPANPMSVRRGYTYTSHGVPVFFLPHPAALSNRFEVKRFDADLRWALQATPQRPPTEKTARVVLTEQDAIQAVCEIQEARWTAYDVETVGRLHSPGFAIISLAVCAQGSDDAWVWDEAALCDPLTSKPLLEWLQDDTAPKLGQNVKYDNQSVRLSLGVEVRGIAGDTRLWRKLLDADAAADLDTMSSLVGMGGHKADAVELVGQAVKRLRKADRAAGRPAPPSYKSLAYEGMPRRVLLSYNARDAVSTARLGTLLEERVRANDALWRTWSTLVRDASLALEQIELWGMPVDRTALDLLNRHLTSECARLSQALTRDFPDYNPASASQTREILFNVNGFGLVPTKRTPSGAAAVDKEVLTRLAGPRTKAGRFARDVLAWRRCDKLRGTYAEGLARYIQPDGRIHPSLNLDGAASGRLSCQNPNLQNIPRAETTEGRMCRDVFIAAPGHKIVQFDYSQLELRVAAVLSGDPGMREIFMSGEDYHLRTAKLVSRQAWGIDPSQVEKKHRSAAKAVNFGVLYGQGAGRLSKTLGCTKREAEGVMSSILGEFRVLKQWIDEQRREVKRNGYSWTWWDGKRARRRPLFDVAHSDEGKRAHAERSSWNTPIQGTAADFCLASIIEVVKWTRSCGLGARVIMTVHDSILLEVPDASVDRVCFAVVGIMEGWPSNGVPLVADVEVGQSWGSLEKYTPAATESPTTHPTTQSGPK